VGSAPNWAEQVTAIATSVGAIGLLAAILAAIHAGRQVREARIGREAQMAVELDYFEQLAALEKRGAFDFELIKLLLGRTLIARWEMWRPALTAVHGAGVYPLFEQLAAKMRAALDDPSATGAQAAQRA